MDVCGGEFMRKFDAFMTDVVLVCSIITAAVVINLNVPSKEPEPTYDEFSYVTDVLEDAAEVLEEMHEDAYILSAEERDLIERVVCAEAEDHSFIGKAAVALCIRNYCELFDMRPEYVFRSVSYADPRDYATDEVKQAVSAVFDTGFRVTEEPILYFYDTAGGYVSKWHESQTFIIEIDSHRYFMRNK